MRETRKSTRTGLLAAAFLASRSGRLPRRRPSDLCRMPICRRSIPMGSTANIVKMHGFMIYDTLYGLDENFVPQPQMVEDDDAFGRSQDLSFHAARRAEMA